MEVEAPQDLPRTTRTPTRECPEFFPRPTASPMEYLDREENRKYSLEYFSHISMTVFVFAPGPTHSTWVRTMLCSP